MILITIAKSKEDWHESFHIRYKVFIEEFKFMDQDEFPDKLERDEYDDLETTTHFIARNEGKGVGTARLIGPNKKIPEKKNKKIFGLPMEDIFDLSEYKKLEIAPFEISRSSVIKEARSSRVILDIWKTVVKYTQLNNISTLCSCAGTETDCITDARIIYDLLKLRRFTHDDIFTKPIAETIENPKPRYEFYDNNLKSEIEKQGGLNKKNIQYLESLGLKLPATLDYYSRIGFKFTGPPVLFPKFKMFTLPMVLDMDKINEPFKTFFKRENPFIKL